MPSRSSGSWTSWRVTARADRPPAERAVVAKARRTGQQRCRELDTPLRGRNRLPSCVGQRERPPVLAQAVLPEGGQLDEPLQTVEGCRTDAMSEAREHLFATVGPPADGRATFLQDELQDTGAQRRTRTIPEVPAGAS